MLFTPVKLEGEASKSEAGKRRDPREVDQFLRVTRAKLCTRNEAKHGKKTRGD